MENGMTALEALERAEATMRRLAERRPAKLPMIEPAVYEAITDLQNKTFIQCAEICAEFRRKIS